MVADKNRNSDVNELSIEDRIKILYELQQVDSKIDSIRTLRGELPLEVQDLEDEVEGLDTRINNLQREVEEFEAQVTHKKAEIKEAEALIKKYEEQQNNVRNNREFDSLSKEIEFQKLEIELCEKRIKEFSFQAKEKKQSIDQAKTLLDERKVDLANKRKELEDIVSETQKEEDDLLRRSESFQEMMEHRLLSAYKRIRGNARNGLAVVTVQRDACGGCFNKIPPQRQLDIKMRKKIIVCEYCGRILVDDDLTSTNE